MARQGGPSAVVLREATRRAGVVPNAAYRHFRDRDALLQAVSAYAMSQLALAMEDEQDALGEQSDVLQRARFRLRAVGQGYLRFADAESGLFRTAFALPGHLSYADDADSAGRRGRTPFQLLNDALDDLDRAGGLGAGRRARAELLAWSAVHGLAMLTLDGPLRELPAQQYIGTGQQLLDLIDRGL
jgi:AcrR family transcriptional regulator